jgi:hypothetical protein
MKTSGQGKILAVTSAQQKDVKLLCCKNLISSFHKNCSQYTSQTKDSNLHEVTVHADSHRIGGHYPLTKVIQRSPRELQFLRRDQLLFPANRM